MQLKAVHTLLLGILSWNILIVHTLPTLDNRGLLVTLPKCPPGRILVNTLPKCPKGQKLYAGRCRFSA
ncbi:hypothetical protein AWZ03_015341 [Drosophila navojoa]|uniref:Kazal-like domain-containing protein n=1 Tax=Drosophila navojoa TaxID=7232 RepID=A0A484ALQ7_DRONA|nr:hypothetical protein AWZ03_015341 [Drosophila navojoa]